MNCPVCDRDLAPSLSICTSCGAMMYDTVREDLQTKITSGRPTPPDERKVGRLEAGFSQELPIHLPPPPPARSPMVSQPLAKAMSANAQPVRVTPPKPVTAPAVPIAPQIRPSIQPSIQPPIRRHETAGLVSTKTSPTLVGFQSSNSSLPAWRIEVQSRVQQRKGGNAIPHAPQPLPTDTQYPTNGSAALRAEIVQNIEPVIETKMTDPRVASAMRRIEESRRVFLEAEKKATVASIAPSKPYKFDLVSANATAVNIPTRENALPKPRLVSNLPGPAKRDTNKLPPIAIRHQPSDISDQITEPVEQAASYPAEFAGVKRIRIRTENAEPEPFETTQNNSDEIEDLAHFSMRFGAGLFDLIIAAFAAMLILSPIAFASGEWFNFAGLLTFGVVCAVVMFVYMTICLGFYGKTIGMRLFSLELVDAIENEYPSLHQAAVSSSVFILSLIFGGAGFLTVFFNEEKRAAHDLLSGTILVREF